MQTTIILMISSALAASATFFLHKNEVSIVVASCCIGLLGAGLEYLLKQPHLALVIYAGTFVGMTSAQVGNIYLVAFAGLMVGYLYHITGNYFPGFGGRLGALAFMSCLLVFFLYELKRFLK
jgi:hypothetical protein